MNDMMKAVAAIALVIAAFAALAQPHRTEIESEVVERCARWTIAFRLHAEGVDMRYAGTMIHELNSAEHSERWMASVSELVKDKPRGERQKVYDVAAVECFLSGAE